MDGVGVCVGPWAGLRNVCRVGMPREWGSMARAVSGEVGL